LLNLGAQRGLDLLRRWPELQALMINATVYVHASPGLAFSHSAGSRLGQRLSANALQRQSGKSSRNQAGTKR